MPNAFSRAFQRYNSKKSPDAVIAESADPEKSLKKSLTSVDLVLLGIGAIIGGGIFSLSGVGATTAGPAIIWSFILVGFVCALAGLAYSEMAAAIPTSGSAYAYSYTALGETWAWILGWALVLEYAVGSATVAVAWASNFNAFMESVFGFQLPIALRASAFSGVEGGIINLPATLIVLLVTLVLIVGAKESARVTGVMVVIKVAILLFVIAMGIQFIDGANLTLPAPDGAAPPWAQSLGAIGPILAGGAIIFFAYIGFDAVSTTAEETKNPKRALPIGILGSLAICTVLYILASVVLLGMIPYTDLVVPAGADAATTADIQNRLGEPYGYAFEQNGMTWVANIVRLGAVIGIASVLIVLLMGGPRVFFALARDGLLPRSWSKVHSKFGTPYKTTIGTGVGVALFAGIFPLGILAQLTNIGTLFAFILVCIGVIVLRYTQPDLVRPFRVPLNIGRLPVLALLGAILCFTLMFSLGTVAILGFFGWMGLGLIVYALYGIRKSAMFGDMFRVPGAPIPAAMASGPEPSIPSSELEAAREAEAVEPTPKQKDQLAYAREMKQLRARAKAQPGGKGPIKERPAAKKLRKKHGLE